MRNLRFKMACRSWSQMSVQSTRLFDRRFVRMVLLEGFHEYFMDVAWCVCCCYCLRINKDYRSDAKFAELFAAMLLLSDRSGIGFAVQRHTVIEDLPSTQSA